MNRVVLVFFLFVMTVGATYAQSKRDSVLILEKIKSLESVCGKIDFSDPNILEKGIYYKAATLFASVSSDDQRNLMGKANYANKEEKKWVDESCKKFSKIVATNKIKQVTALQKIQKYNKLMYEVSYSYRQNVYEEFNVLKILFIKIKGEWLFAEL